MTLASHSTSMGHLWKLYQVPLNANGKVIDTQNRNETSQVGIHSAMKHALGAFHVADAAQHP